VGSEMYNVCESAFAVYGSVAVALVLQCMYHKCNTQMGFIAQYVHHCVTMYVQEVRQ
jgi:hypothetical protein